ncbi:MAG: serine hydrolase [Bacteroidia bacterium]|nr:serine hydrolase [Bacteroidia bacterium]
MIFLFWAIPQCFFAQSPDLWSMMEGKWTKQVLDTLTLEEKIGQLFMVAAFSKESEKENQKLVETLIKKYKVGGLIFMQGSPIRQAQLTNHYQYISDLPLLIATDAEWGLNMRLDSAVRYPKNMTLGAINDDSLLYDFGKQVAKQLRAIGVHINFAPVVDINNNSANPVIGDRAFGENRQAVIDKSLLVMKGLQENGVIATAKHFPGHGDTHIDSHFDLPVLPHSRERLDTLELEPFRAQIKAGVYAIMMAHLFIPAIDSTPNLPTSLSKKAITDLLRNELKFDGIIFTDALNMKGATKYKYFQPGEIEVKALAAGNDILLYSDHVPLAIEAIKKAVQDSVIKIEEINQKVRRILLLKERMGLHNLRYVSTYRIPETLYSAEAYRLKDELYASAITLARNDKQILPIQNLNQTIAFLQIGYQSETPFYHTLKKYTSVDFFHLPKLASGEQIDSTIAILKQNYSTIIVGLFELSKLKTKRFGLTPTTLEVSCFVNEMNANVIYVLFGSPYGLEFLQNEHTLIIGYEETVEAQKAAAAAIFGGLNPPGNLPISVPNKYPVPVDYDSTIQHFRFSHPGNAGFYPDLLDAIDSIITDAIQRKLLPGCAILGMRGNHIFYDKTFGSLDGQSDEKPDSWKTLWDLASVSKVAATTLAAMKLFEEGKLNLNESVKEYLPITEGTQVGNIKIMNLLQHNAGLPAWIPFWKKTMIRDSIDERILSYTPIGGFNVPISNQLWMRYDYPDSIWAQIRVVKLRDDSGVVYSDLGMIILAKVIEAISRKPLDEYVSEQFYKPMGMNKTTFCPWKKGWILECAPTAWDSVWRKGKVQGFVHDECSALLGGVAGHAGLFSNVYDLAKLSLMLKNKGKFAGKTFLQPETIAYFTSTSVKNSRRGLGWDKPEFQKGKISPCSKFASPETFGHLGFTGIGYWIDPQNDLVFIFLSNRTYPTSANTKFIDENIRIKVMDIFYQAMKPMPVRPKVKRRPVPVPDLVVNNSASNTTTIRNLAEKSDTKTSKTKKKKKKTTRKQFDKKHKKS